MIAQRRMSTRLMTAEDIVAKLQQMVRTIAHVIYLKSFTLDLHESTLQFIMPGFQILFYRVTTCRF